MIDDRQNPSLVIFVLKKETEPGGIPSGFRNF